MKYPTPTVDIYEYLLFSSQYRHCNEVVRAKKPENVSQGVMGPNLLSYITVLRGQYYLGIRKIRSLLKEQLDTTFSDGTISDSTVISNVIINRGNCRLPAGAVNVNVGKCTQYKMDVKAAQQANEDTSTITVPEGCEAITEK